MDFDAKSAKLIELHEHYNAELDKQNDKIEYILSKKITDGRNIGRLAYRIVVVYIDEDEVDVDLVCGKEVSEI